MTISMLFWVIFIIGFIFGGFRNRGTLGVWVGDSLLYWILIAILGIGVFGSPIK